MPQPEHRNSPPAEVHEATSIVGTGSGLARVSLKTPTPKPLTIQMHPPTTRTTKAAAPKRIETMSPSLWDRPAYAKAMIVLLSRTPQPAIDTGTLEIKITGGIRNRTCAKLTGAATA